MRSAWALAALLLLAASTAPGASASPGHECSDQDLVHETALRVTLERDCSLEIAVAEGLTCVGGWGGVIERDLGEHELLVYYCTGGPLPPIALATSGADCTKVAGDHAFGQSVLSIAADCHIQLDIKLYDCVWNCSWQTIVDAGPLTVRHYAQDNS